jgi:hypothetical protein
VLLASVTLTATIGEATAVSAGLEALHDQTVRTSAHREMRLFEAGEGHPDLAA